MNFLQQGLVLGLVQGIAEWLPVSSEGMLVLVMVNFYNASDLVQIIQGALLLHLGTFLAALIYFRRDVWRLLKSLFRFKQASLEDRLVIKFLAAATVISGLLGLALVKFLESVTIDLENFGRYITAAVALLLFITAALQLKSKKGGDRRADDLQGKDSFWLGIAQGFAALPGLSRSGLTVAALLLRDFDKTWALRLSFLMSLPIVLAGNIILNYNSFMPTPAMWVGLLSSFISGLVTIDLLLRLAKRINFGYFVLAFACLTLIAVFI